MKKKLQILILAFLLLLTGFAYSQEENFDIDLVIGTSISELYYSGIRFHYIPNGRIDFNFGSDFNKDDDGVLFAVNLNHAYYFEKGNSKINNKLWAFNSGFSFLVEKGQHEKSTAAYLNLFFTREFPVTKKIFIQPELGISYFIFEHVVNEYDYVYSGHRIRIIPKFGINLFLKI